MFLSIVIPTFRRPVPLEACLRQLNPELQQLPVSGYEILVSDDAADKTLRARIAAEFPWARWLKGPQRGPAANRNSGAAQAIGEWLVFLDDDCIPSSTLLSAYRSAIEKHSTFHVLEGAILPDRAMNRMDEEAPINDVGGVLWSCNFAIRRDLFNRLGGFCEAFPYAALEDVDLRERLKEAKEPFVFVPDAKVSHAWQPVRLGFRYFQIQIYSHRILFGRHPSSRTSLATRLLNLARHAYRQLFVVGPSVGYRGLPRSCARLLLITVIDICLPFVPAIQKR